MKEWLTRHAKDWAENMARDIKSFRVIWNTIYLALFAFLCIWAALYYPNTSLNTAIFTTGGIVSAIFTGYVWSTTKEKEFQNRPTPLMPNATTSDGSEEDASA